MVNMLMVIICSMCVLPSKEGPCCSSVLNSCRTRLATPGKDSILHRQEKNIHKVTGNTDKKAQEKNTNFRLFSLSIHLLKRWKTWDITHPTLVKSFPCACRKLRMNLLLSCRKEREKANRRKVLLIFEQQFYLTTNHSSPHITRKRHHLLIKHKGRFWSWCHHFNSPGNLNNRGGRKWT